MNSKRRDFLISISIVFTLILTISLYLNYVLISLFGLNQENFIFIIIPILIFAIGSFFFLSKSILKPLFKSDERLQKSIKETIHELNIPVSTIKMNSQLLEKNIQDEKALKRLNRIKQATNDLLKLYENMEYEIKKEIDKVDVDEFYLDDVINNSLEKFDDIKKDTFIEVDIPSARLLSDRNGFVKTIDNLISNALKYNDKNNPYIKISFENNNLCIYNKGDKIDTKNLFIIFEKYYQEDSKKDGFGLGLSIVKEFCDKNKIAIKIDSLDEGNIFKLDLKNILI